MPKRRKFPNTITAIDRAMTSQLKELGVACGDGVDCYPLLLADDNITSATVDKVFDDLREIYGSGNSSGRLTVIVDSGGGDVDAAYNLALLFRRYGSARLSYIVPRWAKSAATLLVCGGDSVMMTPVAELGPLDPQITQMNLLEQRVEHFSPLHIEATLELMRNEFEQGNKELAEGLLQRLQFPITLGSFKKSLEIGKQYAEKLLASRMFKDDHQKAREVAHHLVENYADHGFCINVDEARMLGLIIEEPSEAQLEIVWTIHKLAREKAALADAQRRKETAERLKELPAGILDALPPGIANRGQEDSPGHRRDTVG